MKHAVLLAVLSRLTGDAAPLDVIDTHAGAGVYDIGAGAAARSGEAAQGVLRLLADTAPPPVFAPLLDAVRALNGGGATRLYPGSPWLAARALRRRDAYLGCELRRDDFDLLGRALSRVDGRRVNLRCDDGYAVATAEVGGGAGRRLLLVDPPFERADDYARVVSLIAARRRPMEQAALVWTPLKDLETFDAFLAALEATRPSTLVVAQARLRPLDNPMTLNGCALVLVDAPDVDEAAHAACAWVAERLGERGARARVDRLTAAT